MRGAWMSCWPSRTPDCEVEPRGLSARRPLPHGRLCRPVGLLFGCRVRRRSRLQVQDDLADAFRGDIRLLSLRIDGDENYLRLILDVVDEPITAALALQRI